jgi:hypothetical protein
MAIDDLVRRRVQTNFHAGLLSLVEWELVAQQTLVANSR